MPRKPLEEGRNQELLDDEIQQITGRISDRFRGTEAVCLSVYQPTSIGGRIVLIDKAMSDAGKIAALSPGYGAKNMFINPDEKLLWKVNRGPVSSSMLKDYIDFNEESERMKILAIYQERFPSIDFDTDGGHVQPGTRYRLCYVSPNSPDQANRSARAPRLGMLYTFGSSFGDNQSLLKAAKHQGEIVLDVRLRLLLQEVGRFGASDRHGTHSAWKIAGDLGEGIDCALDPSVFLVSKLLLVHHHFYPQHPAGYSLLQKLSGDRSKVFARHGLVAPELGTSEDGKSISQLTRDLESDFAALIGACAWHRNTDNTHAMQVTQRGMELVSDSLSIGLTLLAGRVVHGYTDKTKQRTREGKGVFHIAPPRGIRFPERNLPTFAYDDIRNGASDADTQTRAKMFLETLHPFGPVYGEKKSRGFYAIQNQEWITFSGKPVHQLPSKEWFVSYARARCILEFDSVDPWHEPAKVPVLQQQQS